MARLVMRIKFAQYLVCSFALAGMVACNQQSQSTVVPHTTPEVKPQSQPVAVPKPEPAKPKPAVKPQPTKPVKPVQPVQPVQPVTPVEPQQPQIPGGQAEVTVVTPPAPVQQPVKLKPLGKRVSHVPMKGKYVALTFDDGPHASLTPRALDILNRHGAKGTFFMLGQNASRNKSIVARAAAEGHELGVHTWSHIKMNSSSRAKVDNEVSRTQKVLAEASGVTPRVMRPPYGATNKTLVNHMHDHYGMASILWDVDTIDWRKPGVSKVISTAVNEAKPGSIILVHDIHASTLDALEGIVTGLQARGFKLVTVSELMQIGKREAAEAAAAAAAPVVEPQPVEPAQPETPAAVEPAGQPAAPELETAAESSAEAEQPLQLEQLILN